MVNYNLILCQHVKRLLFACTGFPQISEKFAAHLLARRQAGALPSGARDEPAAAPRLSPAELEREINEYTQIVASPSSRRSVLMFVAPHVLVVCKYLYHLIVITSELDLHDFANNIRQQAGAAGAAAAASQARTQFACLLTNCPTSQDFSYLPLFTLCHPRLAAFYSPTADLGSTAVLAHSHLCFLITGTCVCFPLIQMFVRAGNESFMFIVAPNITTGLLLEEVAELRRLYLMSLRNFCLVLRAERQHETAAAAAAAAALASRARPPRRLHDWPRLQELRNAATGRFELGEEVENEDEDLGAQLDEELARSRAETLGDEQHFSVRDCLPAVRSSWWHSEIAFLYYRIFLHYAAFIVLVCLVLLGLLRASLAHYRRRLAAFDQRLAEQRCFIWRAALEANATGSAGGPSAARLQQQQQAAEGGGGQEEAQLARKAVRLAELNIGWSVWDVLATAPFCLTATCVLAMLGTLIIVLVLELSCWLKELRRLLHVLVEVARIEPLLEPRARRRPLDLLTASGASAAAQPEPAAPTAMATIRAGFMRDTSLGFFRVVTRPLARAAALQSASKRPPTHLETRLAHQELALELLRRQQRQRQSTFVDAPSCQLVLVNLLETLYLNERLFIRLVRLYSKNVAPLIMLANLCSYCVAIHSIYIVRRTSGMAVFAYAIVALLIGCFLLVIALVSNFHAEARRLQPIQWTLIAQLTRCRRPRLKHLRLILFKQAALIDQEGGLAISAFNFRVTYTNVIQVALWSSSLLVLTLKQ